MPLIHVFSGLIFQLYVPLQACGIPTMFKHSYHKHHCVIIIQKPVYQHVLQLVITIMCFIYISTWLSVFEIKRRLNDFVITYSWVRPETLPVAYGTYTP